MNNFLNNKDNDYNYHYQSNYNCQNKLYNLYNNHLTIFFVFSFNENIDKLKCYKSLLIKKSINKLLV